MKDLTIVCNVISLEDFYKKAEVVFGQTLKETEVFFICDLDMGKAIAEKRENYNKKYTIINRFGSGLKEIINKIEGEFCLFIDDEDYISVDYCRMLIDKAKKSNSDIVCADIAYYDFENLRYVYSNLSPLRSICVNYDNETINQMYKLFSEDTADFGLAYGKIIKTNLLRNAFMDSENGDFSKVFEIVIKNANEFSNIHGAYYYRYRMNTKEKKSYFNSILTPICCEFSNYEALKKKIASSKYNIVSFDVFDTLIIRSVYAPTDLFRFLDRRFEELFELSSYSRFYFLRICAENLCRQKIFKEHPDYEDICLDEIYDTFAEEYGFDRDKLEIMKNEEIELEYKFCFARECGKDLYNLAKYYNKKIICTSDMYLPNHIIRGILSKAGYEEIFEVYVSSEERLGKYTGSIYKKLPKLLGVDSETILHIGDNPDVDYKQAIANNIDAFIIPKAFDLFWGYVQKHIKGMTALSIFGVPGTENDYYYAQSENLGVRCMLAMIINKFYDNPYTGFNDDSDFDANPYFIGYFALGMHLWSFVDWIRNECTQYDQVHFFSRDCYVMKEIYDVMNRDGKYPPSLYTHMSRNLVTLCDISCFYDLWSLREKLIVTNASPQKFVKLFQAGLDQSAINKIKRQLSKENIPFDKKVNDEEHFVKTIRIIGDCIDWKKINTFREKLKTYFGNIFGSNDCIVDAGYNGRIEAAISRLCNIRLDSFYMHVGQDMLYERQQKYGFNNKCFYNYHPATTYLVREQFISKLDPPIKGIEFQGNVAQIKYGELEVNAYTKFVTTMIQNAALEFAQDMMAIYGDNLGYIKYRYIDASRPFDFLCGKGKDIDVEIFSCAEFEDDFGLGQRFDLSNYWKDCINRFKPIIVDGNICNTRNDADYEVFIKYYVEAEKLLPKGSKRRALVRRLVKMILRK